MTKPDGTGGSPPELELRSEIAQLRRAVVRLRWLTFGSLLAALAATLSSRLVQSHLPSAPGILRARAFELVDSSGRQVGRFSAIDPHMVATLILGIESTSVARIALGTSKSGWTQANLYDRLTEDGGQRSASVWPGSISIYDRVVSSDGLGVSSTEIRPGYLSLFSRGHWVTIPSESLEHVRARGLHRPEGR